MELTLFYTFAKIGFFTLGGGYAMIPLMEQELVDKRAWLTHAEFLDVLAVAQAAPGIMAINVAIFAGYRLARTRGSLCAALGAAVPSFLIILILVSCFQTYQNNPVVLRIFKGLRPAVVALIAVPVFGLAKSANIKWETCWIPVLAAVLVWWGHVSPMYVIVAAGVGGYLATKRGKK